MVSFYVIGSFCSKELWDWNSGAVAGQDCGALAELCKRGLHNVFQSICHRPGHLIHKHKEGTQVEDTKHWLLSILYSVLIYCKKQCNPKKLGVCFRKIAGYAAGNASVPEAVSNKRFPFQLGISFHLFSPFITTVGVKCRADPVILP